MLRFSHPLRRDGLRGLIFLAITAASSTVWAQTSPAAKVDPLVDSLTLRQKIGQLQQSNAEPKTIADISDELRAAIREGRVGSFLNVPNPEVANELQRIAMTESEAKIPLVFARDVIHGYRTIFPTPLGQAATWNPELVEKGARVAAVEASSMGIRWTFAPMIDISRDSRWGRITESFGEDPYLTSVLAVASVRGYQGKEGDPTSIAATAKHFVGYGAAEGGRDYNVTYIPEPLLHNVYLPPFKAAVDAGVMSIMTAFNDLNGVPASGNDYIIDRVLRREFGYNGVIVSDWDSVLELIPHGFAEDKKQAARIAFNAGMDVEMVSTTFQENLFSLLDGGKVSESELNAKVSRIIDMKRKLGLFEQPYVSGDPEKAILTDEHKALAEQAALESLVLLKNDKQVLPLARGKTVALIGPLAHAAHDQLGSWVLDAKKQDSVTVLDAFRKILPESKLLYSQAMYSSRSRETDFSQVLELARKADVIVFVGGEEAVLSGEAHSRADTRLPGTQELLVRELKKTGKPLVAVLMAGRPLALNDVISEMDALVMAWHPGSMGGPAIARLLMGDAEPVGRLPVTWPKVTGQLPLYYNRPSSGRPAEEGNFTQMDDFPLEAFQHSTGHKNHYIDIGFKPQFPFGFGLSYSNAVYSDLKLSKKTIGVNDTLEVSAKIRNSGKRPVTETVQLYIRDLVASSVRPVRELKNFQRVTLKPGEAKVVKFKLTKDDLAFYNQQLNWVVEPGEFHVWIAPNAEEGLQGQFTVR
ncbi:beta-glucosidase BglX [Saccharophagus sp. K07]|uniref:beta-glucosidase BglX n=1 Tax=Saccharophagus sp. K07 TaxID=2283636 RepID=UPI0016526BFA|nr:beta-glucosidase BglX [Saccharophagus sp. K07]MBC6905430.1 beta-glucosidase BglX [Saccharophagus sp. K07]